MTGATMAVIFARLPFKLWSLDPLIIFGEKQLLCNTQIVLLVRRCKEPFLNTARVKARWDFNLLPSISPNVAPFVDELEVL